MNVNSLPKTVTRQRRGCDLNPGPSAPEFSTGYRATQDTIRDATFNVRSKADMRQLNLPHGTDNEKVENRKTKRKKKRYAHEYQ